MPSREVFIYIPPLLRMLFYLASMLSLFIFIIGFYSRVSLWLRGREEPHDLLSRRLSILDLIRMSFFYFFSKDCLLARRVMKRSKPRGIMLIFIYWGLTILFIGTVTVALDHYLGLGILKGFFYLSFSLILDIAGLASFIGTVFFLIRRVFLSREIVSGWDDKPLLLMIALIILTGFSVEGIRLAITEPPLMDLSFVGALFALIFKHLDVRPFFYSVIWSIHVFFALLFIGFIPFSKQFHMFAAQLTSQDSLYREESLQGLVHD